MIQNLADGSRIFGVLAFVIVYLKRAPRAHLSSSTTQALRLARRREAHAHTARQAASQYEPTFEWPVLWVALVVLAAVGGVFCDYRSRKPPQAARPRSTLEPTVAEDVAASIGDAIDDLEAEPDARRAVIAAYARMEGVLAPQRPAPQAERDAASSTSRRILLGLTSRGDAVERLTDALRAGEVQPTRDRRRR